MVPLARVKELFRSRFILRAIIHAAALPKSSSFDPHDRPIGWGLSFSHFTEEETEAVRSHSGQSRA